MRDKKKSGKQCRQPTSAFRYLFLCLYTILQFYAALAGCAELERGLTVGVSDEESSSCPATFGGLIIDSL